MADGVRGGAEIDSVLRVKRQEIGNSAERGVRVRRGVCGGTRDAECLESVDWIALYIPDLPD